MRLLALLLILSLTHVAQAAESRAVVSKRATVTLVSDTDSVAPGAAYRLGLRFRLAPGWHIYSRNPGDAGIPPELEWTLPLGTTTGPIAWPAPQRLPEGPLMTFGYTGDVLLAVPAQGPGPVRLQARWLICSNICVPEEGDFALDQPPGTATPSAETAVFALGAATLPLPSSASALLSPDGVLTVADIAAGVSDAWFIPDTPDQVTPTGRQIFAARSGDVTLRLPLAARSAGPFAGVLTLQDSVGGQRALHLDVLRTTTAGRTPFLAAIGFALLGGLILNLMPCVFPVLAMKAMALLRLSTAARGTARAHAASTAAGMVLSFAAIGLAVLLLRQAGGALGWGFQFQSPIFVTAMAWVLFAVGLNLSGVFDIAGSITNAGQGLTLRGGLLGSFASGALAVLVATPCTAPFMGVALAEALAAPPAEALALFGAMGFGFATPLALLTLAPGTGRLLPKPGRWMELLRQGLAFPMYAACLWLVWVATQQTGSNGILIAGGGLVLVGFAAWALRLGPRLGAAVAIAALVSAGVLLPQLVAREDLRAAQDDTFSPTRLAALRAEGRPVFLNFTAAWCVSCLVNERVALGNDSVRRAFTTAGVVSLVGDWTRQDPAISAFLQAQGRDGVPLYLLYPRGAGAPETLPQLLTPAIVLAALARLDQAPAGRP